MENEGFRGPFDKYIEKIIEIFVEKGAFARNGATNLGEVRLVFWSHPHCSLDDDKERIKAIVGNLYGRQFIISLDNFCYCDSTLPGHCHSCTAINISDYLVYLFRKFPEVYIWPGEERISPPALFDEALRSHYTYSNVIYYRPSVDIELASYESDEVITDCLLSTSQENKFHASEIHFKEIEKIFIDFFQQLIEYLEKY